MAFLCMFSAPILPTQTPPIVPVTPESISRSPGARIKPGQVRTPLTWWAAHHQALNVIEAESLYRCQKPQCRVKTSRDWRNRLEVQRKMLVRKI